MLIRRLIILLLIVGCYKKNVKPVGFIVTRDKIYLSLNNGKLIVVDIATGKSIDIFGIEST